jgi:hypothetical protein
MRRGVDIEFQFRQDGGGHTEPEAERMEANAQSSRDRTLATAEGIAAGAACKEFPATGRSPTDRLFHHFFLIVNAAFELVACPADGVASNQLLTFLGKTKY